MVLLEGVACFSSQHEDGRRQIHALRYPGDFFGLDGFLSPRSAERSEVQALTRCSIGTIDRDALEQAMQRHPAIGRALWRAALTEVSVFRQRQVVSRLPELQRIAHFLCEQLARLEIDEGVIPLTQIDVADAAGLSVAHANRIFQELRQLDVLSKQPLIEVVNKGHLHKLAAFDARYLDLGESLSRWGPAYRRLRPGAEPADFRVPGPRFKRFRDGVGLILQPFGEANPQMSSRCFRRLGHRATSEDLGAQPSDHMHFRRSGCSNSTVRIGKCGSQRGGL